MARSRRRRKPGRPGPAGFLVVDKPAGWTSHDVVDAARGWFGNRRIGHLGTLDPQATGVLPLAVREATKLVSFFDGSRKSYVGTVCLGIETDTLDGEGRETARFEGELPGEEAVRQALAGFLGEIEQVPPMYSAVKQGGVPLHRLARRGEVVHREPKKVHVHHLEATKYASPDVEIGVDCSAGTYVRSLAADLGTKLGCGAYLKALRRTRSGPFAESDARTVEELERAASENRIEELLLSPAETLDLPVFRAAPAATRPILQGADVSPGTQLRVSPGDKVLVTDDGGRLLALMELRADRRLWPLRVLAVE
ncbi:MAG: tRNA pseudouridine(55) synthase TruB [Myxococcota bacterium]